MIMFGPHIQNLMCMQLVGSGSNPAEVKIPQLSAKARELLQLPETYKKLHLGHELTRIPTDVHKNGGGVSLRCDAADLAHMPVCARLACVPRCITQHADLSFHSLTIGLDGCKWVSQGHDVGLSAILPESTGLACPCATEAYLTFLTSPTSSACETGCRWSS